MKVVFFEDVEGTAQVGEVKEVKNGFARNFLLPRSLAAPANRDNIQRATALAQKEARRQEKLDVEARAKLEKVQTPEITIEARVGETGRLFGSVTNRDIAEKLNEVTGLDVDPHIVLLPEPIRELSTRTVNVKFTRNVILEVTVNVVADEASKPALEKYLAEQEAERARDEAMVKAQAEARALADSADDSGTANVRGEPGADSADDAEVE